MISMEFSQVSFLGKSFCAFSVPNRAGMCSHQIMGRSDHNIDFITMINSIINNSAHTFTDYKMGFGIKDPTTCRFPQYIRKFDVAFYI